MAAVRMAGGAAVNDVPLLACGVPYRQPLVHMGADLGWMYSARKHEWSQYNKL